MAPSTDLKQPMSTDSLKKDLPTNAVRPKTTGASLKARSNYSNQGTAMDLGKRKELGVMGLQPIHVESLATQKRRAMRQLRSKSNMLEKYIFMAQLRSTNIHLFYKIVMEELEELAPVIYTPTVGTACLEYSNIYPFLAGPGVPDGLYLTKAELPELREMIKNYQPFPEDHEPYTPQIAVISDGSRILGLGDLGVNGMGIPIGKLQLYVAAAGIDARKTLPILLDMGTNNDNLRNDEFYLGMRQPRTSNDTEFYETVDAVLKSLHDVYPDMLIQFEDWSSEHAFGILERYQDKILCFNDDIQGTGAVILSGVINAIKKVQKESGVAPEDHRIVFYGAGSAAIGVAKQIQDYFQIEHKIPEKQAREMFWIVDSKGLVTENRGDRLAQHKVYYARSDNDAQYKDLIDIVNYVKPTMLIGLSSIPQAFTTEVLARLAKLNGQPIVFPLSNPATQAECTFEQAMEATNNKVIFASGTAFPSYTIAATGEVRIPGQGNNMYIFPGLGLGAILSQSKMVSNRMIYCAAKALAESLTPEEIKQGWLYPTLQRIRHVSALVATAVCEEARNEDLARSKELLNCSSHDSIMALVKSKMWSPVGSDTNDIDSNL